YDCGSDEERFCRQVIDFVRSRFLDPERADAAAAPLEGGLCEHLQRGTLRLPAPAAGVGVAVRRFRRAATPDCAVAGGVWWRVWGVDAGWGLTGGGTGGGEPWPPPPGEEPPPRGGGGPSNPPTHHPRNRSNPAGRGGRETETPAAQPFGRSAAGPCSHDRLHAVLTSPTWENACGKLPTSRRARGSYSSDSRPTSLHRPTSRSNSRRASSRRPSRTRVAARQEVQARNAPSPGGRPSPPVSVG